MKNSLLCLLLLVTSFVRAQIPQYATPLGTTASNTYPFSNVIRVQLLYAPNDFTSLPPTGFLTAIYFRSDRSTTASYTGFELKMGQTGVTGFAAGAWYPTTTVIPSSTYTLSGILGGTAGSNNGWVQIPLPAPYYYDNTQSLVIDITVGGYSGGFYPWQSSATNHRLYGATTAGAPSGPDALRYDFGVDVFAGYPCTDTPKTALAGPDKVCPGDTFTIQPAVYYNNATYQYQYSNNGITWSNFTGPLGLYGDIKDAIYTQPKWYRCKITCNANTTLVYTTPAKRVDIAPFYFCYCKNAAKEENNGADVGNFKVISAPQSDTLLDNGSYVTQLSNNQAVRKYTAFMDSVAPVVLYRQKDYVFAVTQFNFGSSLTPTTATVFLDINRDGIYDEKTERVMEKYTDGITGIAFDTFKIPADAAIGLTGLRVVLGVNNPAKPCGDYNGDGEVEDYLADIRWDPCTGPVNAGVIAGDTSVCVGYDYVVRNERYETMQSGFTRAWEISGDNKTWFNVTGSLNQDELPRVFNGQPLYYRVRAVCEPTRDTTYTPELLVNLKAPYKCYCFSQAVGGAEKDSSDIGGFTLASISQNDGGTHLLNPSAVKKRSDYTDNVPVDLDVDSLYTMTVFHTMKSGLHGDAKITVFMDFNNNNQYDLPEDLVYTGYTSVGNFTVVDSVRVKQQAILNVPTGLRVILNNDIAPNNQSDAACGIYTSGETEDYMIMFRKKGYTGVGVKSRGIQAVSVSPNPNKGIFTVAYSELLNEEAGILVRDIAGKVIFEQTYPAQNKIFKEEINLGGISQGVYFLEFISGEYRTTEKIIVNY